MRLHTASHRWLGQHVDTAGGPPAAEGALLLAVVALCALAAWLPAIALPAAYHGFADQRVWLGLPHAADVLSNLPFAAMGVWGLAWLRRLPAGRIGVAQRGLAGLFFLGLIATTFCSAVYHLAPDHIGLCIDRLGMSLAFAGLLGLAAADRINARAGAALAVVVAVAAPTAALIDGWAGNMTPWAVLQGGGLVLLAALALRRPQPRALGFSIVGVIAFYAVAKVLELADAPVFALTQEFISGHSAKHVAAAWAAWPVVRALQRAAWAGPVPAARVTMR
ncbi:hypothetical protein [Ottowia testudinis]|uniref:Ceramidase n=1 Tax=Ottowia testudinis TaxID=2816950 RepID=A0A975CJ40_9BURK|nr:hypothetical protein [Ottowia testudinis]QTD45119.1 hypothetical protein J1M35_19180 [Ottowia testudinis]